MQSLIVLSVLVLACIGSIEAANTPLVIWHGMGNLNDIDLMIYK